MQENCHRKTESLLYTKSSLFSTFSKRLPQSVNEHIFLIVIPIKYEACGIFLLCDVLTYDKKEIGYDNHSRKCIGNYPQLKR